VTVLELLRRAKLTNAITDADAGTLSFEVEETVPLEGVDRRVEHEFLFANDDTGRLLASRLHVVGVGAFPRFHGSGSVRLG
jgi:hypothetical protein